MEVFGFEMSVTLMLVIGMTVMLAWYDWWCHQYFQRRGIPVAGHYIPFFGNILQWRHGLHITFTDYVKKNGKVVGAYSFRRPVLIITDPDILKNILVKNFSNFCNRRSFPLSSKPFNKVLPQLKNETWKEVRSVITPSFSASKMRLMSSIINECCDRLVSSFSRVQDGGNAADCRELFGAFTMDAIARCGFGLNVDSQQNKDDPFVKNAKNAFNFTLFSPAALLPSAFPFLIPIMQFFKIRLIDANVVKFFSDVTDAARSLRKEEGDNAAKHVDFLQLMLNAHNDSDDDCEEMTHSMGPGKENGKTHRKALSTDMVTAQAVVFFLAGYETTNTLLTFASYVLATNPDIQEKLHAEIDDIAPTRDNLDYDVISKMEYLDMVINETLRMYPPTVTFNRICNDTITYDGLTIEKGLNVIVSIWTLHYDEDYWSNPTKFDPERFSAENKGSIQPCTYVPFGFGPRNCIGMRFALFESKMALVRVLQQYHLDVCAETEIPPKLGKTAFLAPKTLMLQANKRK